ncbi:hypothetical protein ACET3X_008773 [Alternaria dauci]|uniref:Glutathione S-transferase n=1 Tax=Alternaria dauci TaxID=48095 RepID=A0ABR3UDX2_9PLEO
MSISLKPIVIYGKHGPNPPKIRMLCEELDLAYEAIDKPFPDLKTPEYLAINPNGRVPAIYDPNTNLTLWESGAIIEYLVDKYDRQHRLSFPQGSDEYYLAKQWLYFQVSGQGPYYGQAMWFLVYHPEQIPSAQTRYYREIERVTSVLDSHLKRQEQDEDGPWLVGNKFSFADLAFVPWQNATNTVLKDKVDVSEFRAVAGWLARLNNRVSIKKIVDDGPKR